MDWKWEDPFLAIGTGDRGHNMCPETKDCMSVLAFQFYLNKTVLCFILGSQLCC